MEDHEWLAQRFEQHRAHLRAVAYRMLGSLPEADEAVQDTWLRLSRSGAEGVENLDGWLTTIVARVCLNVLQARRARPEQPAGLRMPDPVIRREGAADPEQEALLADSVGLPLLVVLDTLSPAERLALVLHDLFDLPFEEIAAMVGRSPTAARQLASRARRRVQGAAVPPDIDVARHVKSWTHSLPPVVPETSMLLFECSTPTWCCGRTCPESASRGAQPESPEWRMPALGGEEPRPCSLCS